MRHPDIHHRDEKSSHALVSCSIYQCRNLFRGWRVAAGTHDPTTVLQVETSGAARITGTKGAPLHSIHAIHAISFYLFSFSDFFPFPVPFFIIRAINK